MALGIAVAVVFTALYTWLIALGIAVTILLAILITSV